MDRQLIEEFNNLYFAKNQIARRVKGKKELEEIWDKICEKRKVNSKTTYIKNRYKIELCYNITSDVIENIDYLDKSIEYEMIKYLSKRNKEKIMLNAKSEEIVSSMLVSNENLNIKEIQKRITSNGGFIIDNLKKDENQFNDEIITEIYIIIKDIVNVSKQPNVDQDNIDSSLREDIRELVEWENSIRDSESAIIISAIIQFYIINNSIFDEYSDIVARYVSYYYLIYRGYGILKYSSPSRIMLKEKRKYRTAIINSQINEGDITYFIKYYLKVLKESLDLFNREVASKYGEKIIKELIDDKGVYIEDRQMNFIDKIITSGQEIVTINDYKEKNKVSYETARGDLNYLVTLGFFKIGKSGKKYEYYLNNISTIIESFEE